jgi:putative flippase GtrA
MNKNIVYLDMLLLANLISLNHCLDKKYMNNRRFFPIKQFFQFNFVGILNAIVSYSVFIFSLNYFNYIISLLVSHLIGVANSYIWNKNWTFKENKSGANEFLKFNLVYVVVFVVNVVSLSFLVEALKFNPVMGQLIVLPIIAIISFIGHKHWSFN